MKRSRLYIIHGWTYTIAPWSKTIEILRKKGLDVRMLQVPGLTSPSTKVWTIEEYMKWADSMIPQGAIALGHSNGGRILLNLCSEKPEKLRHLILLDAAGIYEESTKRDVSKAVSKKLKFLKKIPGVEKVWHKLLGASDYDRAPANMKETLSNMLVSDQSLDLARIKVPTSILWGAEDNITPVRQAEAMHERIKGSSLKIFPGWNHAPYILHPEELADVIYQAYFHPPEKIAGSAAADTQAVSAAFALKKAPEPVLKAQAPATTVAPSIATKLVLRKDERITEGMVISDEEGAAVRYQVKTTVVPTKNTDTSQISASTAFRKAKVEIVPDIDTVAASASASLKKDRSPAKMASRASKKDSEAGQRAGANMKTGRTIPQATSSQSIKSLASPEAARLVSQLSVQGDAEARRLATQTSVQRNISSVPLVPQIPAGAITSASVAKISRLEKAKRKVRNLGQKGGKK